MAHRFAVWAPLAGGVEVVIGEKGWPMAPVPPLMPGERGWWEATVGEAGPGTDYGFRLEGGPVRPDPRSTWQPEGVDGPSRVVDHGAFAWHDQAWRGLHLPSAVLYELHVGTFSAPGTFDGAVEHLDHLVALGVDGIELLPVAEFSGDRGWGYDGVDLFAPHHAYGGPDGLKRLVDACHTRGLGVVMDVVYNHLGPSGNYLAEFGPYFTDRHHTGWGDAVNFDGADSDGVRAFVVDNAVMWLRDYHCDGLRLDAIHAIVDQSARHIVEAVSDAVHRFGGHARRPLFVVAESDLNDPRVVRSGEGGSGGYSADAAWADDLHHALHAVLSGESEGYYADFGLLAQLAAALREAWVYTGQYSPFRRRVHGRPAAGIDGSRFVVALQNHDQVGNRATGDRITDLPRVSPGRARVGAALVVLGVFVPMLFQGEEWAASTPFLYFTDHHDPELGRAVSDGRRREFAAFGWKPEDVPDPQDEATFLRSKLDWEELRGGEHASMLDWYRRLIALRRQLPALSDGRRDLVRTSFDEEQGWLVVTRGPVTVAVNLGPDPVALPVTGSVEMLASSEPAIALADGAVELPPDSVAVLLQSP
jgi:maltooligosyltrehalose trehalohydrolase